ncbi:MFS transporter [Clostridium sp. PL3]|uniref:MFS transporter n=1 Tax=Clostridium thailandense TaxID=2794346 RepID=A0A949WTJ8_9CLOT|nr:MFS transporter [Clostridium thailandense]MBV7276410.1 MFS transporter [Clostridium thailandense]
MNCNLEINTSKSKNISSGLMVSILTLAAASAPICMSKVSPIMPVLMKALDIREAQAGLLISVFSMVGIFLAIPGGFVIHKFGPRKSGLIGLSALIFGSLVGTYTSSFTPLLITRIIEGVGMALLSIVGPVIIGMSFSSEKRGAAMGLFTTFSVVGQSIMLIVAPRIAGSYGWKGVWWFATIYAIVFLVIWFLFIKNPPASNHENVNDSDQAAENSKSDHSALKNKSVWFLAITLCLFLTGLMSLVFFLPTYLNLIRGMSMTKASSMVSVVTLLGIPFGIVGGILSDKIGSRRWFSIILMVITAILFGTIPLVPTDKIIFSAIGLGIVPGMVLPPIFAAVTEVLDDQKMAGIAMGLLSTGQNVGMALGAAGFGAIVQASNWSTAFFTLVPITILGAIFMMVNKRVR